MGSGDIGSNGSVHWKVTYDDDAISADHMDYDNVLKHKDIGKSKGHTGKFRVTARFNSEKEAGQAIRELAARFAKVPSSTIFLDVNTRPQKPKPGPSHEWEIRIDW
jgi:hypothetical protein